MPEAGGGAVSIRAVDAGGLPPIVEVLAGQEFRESDIRFEAARRRLWIPFRIKFGRHSGKWRLAFEGARDWSVARDGVHDVETLKTIAIDAKTRVVTIECLRDTVRIEVERVDLLLEREADAAPDAQEKPLPEWFRKEVEEKRAGEAAAREDYTRVVGSSRRDATVLGAVLSAGLVLAIGGHPLLGLAIALPVSAGTMWWCTGHPDSPLLAAFAYGLPGLGMMFAMGDPVLTLLFGVFHVAGGPLIVQWMHQRRSLQV